MYDQYLGKRVVITTRGNIIYGSAGSLRVHHIEHGVVYLSTADKNVVALGVPLRDIKKVGLFRETAQAK